MPLQDLGLCVPHCLGQMLQQLNTRCQAGAVRRSGAHTLCIKLLLDLTPHLALPELDVLLNQAQHGAVLQRHVAQRVHAQQLQDRVDLGQQLLPAAPLNQGLQLRPPLSLHVAVRHGLIGHPARALVQAGEGARRVAQHAVHRQAAQGVLLLPHGDEHVRSCLLVHLGAPLVHKAVRPLVLQHVGKHREDGGSVRPLVLQHVGKHREDGGSVPLVAALQQA
mmetsp:Transcript_23361/g.51271  ORF Transcript_23361/g.51271 Transcript_23361/m.51271 type:complete len:221 (+) Transcript_23361:835-1497(+)